MFKVIVAGSRNFNNYEFLKNTLNYLLINQNNIEIVSGTANGADKLGEMYARKLHLGLKQFPADWDQYGKRAGYLRNEQMAKYADALVAFWDSKSVGTKHMIDLAGKYKLLVRVINY